MARTLKMLRVSDVDDEAWQMRANDDTEGFDDLVGSVRRDGVLVPILVVGSGDRFNVVAGHRRCAAARRCDLGAIPAYVLDADEVAGWSHAFAENMFRKDLTPIEEGAAIQDALDGGEYDAEGLSRALNRSLQWIRDRLAILAWPEELQAAVHRGLLAVGAAWNLAKIGDAGQRETLISYAVENGATARTTAAWLQAWQATRAEVQPERVGPEGSRAAAPPVEPYAPCVICGSQQKMVELSYQPVCGQCGPELVRLCRERLQAAGGGGGGGGG